MKPSKHNSGQQTRAVAHPVESAGVVDFQRPVVLLSLDDCRASFLPAFHCHLLLLTYEVLILECVMAARVSAGASGEPDAVMKGVVLGFELPPLHAQPLRSHTQQYVGT